MNNQQNALDEDIVKKMWWEIYTLTLKAKLGIGGNAVDDAIPKAIDAANKSLEAYYKKFYPEFV